MFQASTSPDRLESTTIRVIRPENSAVAPQAAPVPGSLVIPKHLVSLSLGLITLMAATRPIGRIIALIVVGGYFIYQGLADYFAELPQNRASQDSKRVAPTSAETRLERELRHEQQRDFVDEQSWESFPASDPPSSGPTPQQ